MSVGFFGCRIRPIVNGKIITDIDISRAFEIHKSSGALATMVLKKNHTRERFTEVVSDGKWVEEFRGFPAPNAKEEVQSPLMFTGIHILDPRVFDYIPRGEFSDIVKDIYRPALEKGDKVAAHVAEGNWYELSTIPRYLDISLAMMNGRTVFSGDGCAISDEAIVRDSIMWDDVSIEDGADLYRTIIADGVTIRENESIENAAIVRADMVRNCDEIPEKSLKGFIQGDNYIVPLS
ncbi:MAG: NDP-sugar synthase [Acidobacteria bacterium]|nr:NDP-sugar synthase [Acidobacteriota bacterium]